jgi:hypothetical protein
LASAFQNPQQKIEPPSLLPLDLPELPVQIVYGEIALGHVFRRIKQADWNAYFTGKAEPAEGLALYRRAILRVEGYQNSDGRGPEDLEIWPECIPLEDRLSAIESLMNTFWRFTIDSFQIADNGRRVAFEVLSSDGLPGPMHRFYSLVHSFRLPTDEDRQRFDVRAIQGGGGDSAFTSVVSLYDELIEFAEGYSVSGRELGDNKELIVIEMDAYHKAMAVAILFNYEGLRSMPGKIVTSKVSALGPETFARMRVGKKIVN